jgi:hypothetical protein
VPENIKKPLPSGRGRYPVANRDVAASPAGRDAPRVAGYRPLPDGRGFFMSTVSQEEEDASDAGAGRNLF